MASSSVQFFVRRPFVRADGVLANTRQNGLQVFPMAGADYALMVAQVL
jgi:hypothetical protein